MLSSVKLIFWKVFVMPLLFKKYEVIVASELLQSIQSVVPEHKRDLEVSIHSQLVGLLHKIALPLVNFALVVLELLALSP